MITANFQQGSNSRDFEPDTGDEAEDFENQYNFDNDVKFKFDYQF